MPHRFALRFNITGLYVSFISTATVYALNVTKIMLHWLHCQLLYCAVNPPTTGLSQSAQREKQNCQREIAYPREGPANGAARKMLVASARCRRGNRSAFVPAPTASAGLPVNPARNRQIARLPNELENPAPSVKSMKIGPDTMYTIRRP